MVIGETNDATYWREFERSPVTHSAAHYLMAIDNLRKDFGYARVTDVADSLDVSRGAASMALSHLRKRKLVAQDPRRFLSLTPEGGRLVREVERNFGILSEFFERIVGVTPEVAQVDACKMEHLMSLETGRGILRLMRFILSDPERAAQVRQGMAQLEDTCAGEEQADV
ncbi:MAG: hypothetical protein GWP08_06155 [Nitrospiraceae bacterium]|nr:hypothetical protein [Nitrospiraceae bacterium]